MVKITKVKSDFVREPLLHPFGFKGGYLNEAWQTACYLKNVSGNESVGLGTQSVLWSDSKVFTKYSESAGNSIMYLITEYALKIINNTSFRSPFEVVDNILPEVYSYGKKLCEYKNLRLTFVLNALVAVDNAVWMLYAKEKKTESFDALLPEEYKKVLNYKHTKLGIIPLISYGVSLEDVKKIIDDGHFLLKIKIGSDPDKDGDYDKMLSWDMKRIKDIHNIAKKVETQYTETGNILYYLDANGRYDTKDRLTKLLDYAREIGAFNRIVILEEPFDEKNEVDVSDLDVIVAADESAHSLEDVKTRIDMGYKAIALKPIAKTLSMSLRIAKYCINKKVPCFCADLTVNPILVEWNKVVACRLPLLTGIKIGVFETNGHQNYKNWATMCKQHPCYGAEWTKPNKAVFNLTQRFYKISGGIFKIPENFKPHVSKLNSIFRRKS